MLRKDHLPPNEACFQVPLRFTKFDLRDYLWNLYDVEVKKVRSYVKEQPLTQRLGTRSWYRPQPKKIMTVELAQPFQWPAVPENAEPWSKELFDMRQRRQDEAGEDSLVRQKMDIPLKSRKPRDQGRRDLAALAEKMLAGEVQWSNDVALDPKWDKLLEETKAKVGVKKEAVEQAVSETKTTTKTTTP
jgi:large subunit ribosomal protein L23